MHLEAAAHYQVETAAVGGIAAPHDEVVPATSLDEPAAPAEAYSSRLALVHMLVEATAAAVAVPASTLAPSPI